MNLFFRQMLSRGGDCNVGLRSLTRPTRSGDRSDWTPAASEREAFKDESRRLDANGGIDSPSNYNRIDSPGRQFRQEDGGL